MADLYKPELTQPGVSPGYIQPAATYATNQPGINYYTYSPKHLVQTTDQLARYNTLSTNPYGNPNAQNLGTLVTPEQLGYPSQQSQAAAQGSANPMMASTQGIHLPPVYDPHIQMNTAAPAIPGHPNVFAPATPEQMAAGISNAQQYGASLGFVALPPHLTMSGPLIVNHDGGTDSPTQPAYDNGGGGGDGGGDGASDSSDSTDSNDSNDGNDGNTSTDSTDGNDGNGNDGNGNDGNGNDGATSDGASADGGTAGDGGASGGGGGGAAGDGGASGGGGGGAAGDGGDGGGGDGGGGGGGDGGGGGGGDGGGGGGGD